MIRALVALRSRAWPVVVLTLVTLVALAGLLAASPRLAAAIVREDGPVEWVQVGLFAGAAAAAFAAARRPPAAPDVLLVIVFAAFIELELDLDRRILGRSVIDKKFLTDPLVPLPLRLLTALMLLGLAAAVLAYAWRHRADLAGSARALMRTPSGRLLLVGLALMLAVQPFERALGLALPLPKYFLEESLELLAGLYCFLAVIGRALRDKSGWLG